MIEIKSQDLCFVGKGAQFHIRYNENYTYCSARAENPVGGNWLLSLTEEAENLCKKCLREYKRRLRKTE